MFEANLKMKEELKKISLNETLLCPSLMEVLDSGFILVDDLIFIKKLKAIETNATLEDFVDRTGYECFINSVNIDDYTEGDFLKTGIAYVSAVFKKWKLINSKDEIFAIFSLDEFGLKIKLHLNRIGERWLSNDLDKYEEAVLVIGSNDLRELIKL